MRTIDMTPLMRATVGFDRMMNMLDASPRLDEGALSYPPYNIEKIGEDAYRIVMAVAGFGEDELDITVKENSLVVTGKKDKPESGDDSYLYRGIAARAFERRFDLADHIRVTGARTENGMLFIELAREVPEAMKPRSIKIETRPASGKRVLEGKAA